MDRLIASLLRRGDQSGWAEEGGSGGGQTAKLVLLAAERGDEQAAGLAASLWSVRGGGISTVLSHSGQHMDELLELAKELGAEAVVLAGTDTARLAFGDRNGDQADSPHAHYFMGIKLRIMGLDP